MSLLGIENSYEFENRLDTTSTITECSWSSDPDDLANHSYLRLLQIRADGGSVLVMNADKTRGLSSETSSYIQFMWQEQGALIVEIQGDYSYWGLSIASNRWPIFHECGMQTPTGGVGNFVQEIPESWSPEKVKNVLSKIFRAFLVVLAPVGDVREATF